MKRLILFCIIISVCCFSTGQSSASEAQFSFCGAVFDGHTKYPIPGASVVLDNDIRGSVADSLGCFCLDQLPLDTFDLKISCLGYIPISRTVHLAAEGSDTLTFYLEPTTILFDNITVSASRFGEDIFISPMSVSTTSHDEFSERTSSTVADLLREEPGLLVQKTTYGHGSPIIRGLMGRHVLLLYDGIRLNKSTFRFGANQYLNTLDPETISRIEVVRGPSSVMYGSDALGGVINLIPGLDFVSGKNHDFKASLTTSYASADDGKTVRLTAVGQRGPLLANLHMSAKDIGHLRGGSWVGEQIPTGWKETDYSGRVAWRFDGYNRLAFDYQIVRQKDVPRYDKYVCGDFEKYIYDPQDRDLYILSYQSEPRHTFIQQVQTAISYQSETEGSTTQKTGASKIGIAEDRIATWGGYAQFLALPLRSHRITGGGEAYREKINSSAIDYEDGISTAIRPAYPDNTIYTSSGAFLQDTWSIRTNIQFVTGLRLSRYAIDSPLEDPFETFSETYWNLTEAMAFAYQPASTVNLIARWSHGFRAPNLNDAVVLKYSSSGVDAPSFDLTPEHSRTIELGVKIRTNRLQTDACIFYTHLSDLIDRRSGLYDGKSFYDENDNDIKDSTEYDIYQKFNVGSARIYGFEWNGSVFISPVWRLGANAFWIYGESISDHEPMSRIPPAMAMISVRRLFTEHTWLECFTRLAGSQRRLSARDRDDTRIDPDGTASWSTVNLRGRVSIKYIAINVNLENIFDVAFKEHGSGIYSPGRNIMVTLKMETPW